MKIQNIDNVEKFFKVVDSCKGKVGPIEELEVIAYEPEDTAKLVEFMMEG